MNLREFKINIPDAQIDDLKHGLQIARLTTMEVDYCSGTCHCSVSVEDRVQSLKLVVITIHRTLSNLAMGNEYFGHRWLDYAMYRH